MLPGLWRNVLGVVRTVFRFGAPVDEAARVYWDDPALALNLTNFVHDIETRASGRVQVITLAEFRANIPDLWERYRERILLIAESTIARTIGKGNTFIPQDEDTWLLLYPALTEDRAQERTDEIAAKIGDKLLGARFSAHETPLPATARLDLTEALKDDGTLDLDGLRAAVEKARRAQTRANIRAVAKPLPKKPATPGERSMAARLKVLYRPAWCQETQTMDSFFFRAFTDMGANVFDNGGPLLNVPTTIELVKMAARAFEGMRADGLRAKFAIPIQFAALDSRALPEIQRIIGEIPQRDRLLQLRIEITRAPARALIERLVNARELFRPSVREVAFIVDPFALQDHALALDHVILGADITADRDRRDDEVSQAMLMFRERAAQRVTYVMGLHSKSQLSHAVEAGIAEVGGSALHDDFTHLPKRTVTVSREELVLP
jgi:hypothetical protein